MKRQYINPDSSGINRADLYIAPVEEEEVPRSVVRAHRRFHFLICIGLFFADNRTLTIVLSVIILAVSCVGADMVFDFGNGSYSADSAVFSFYDAIACEDMSGARQYMPPEMRGRKSFADDMNLDYIQSLYEQDILLHNINIFRKMPFDGSEFNKNMSDLYSMGIRIKECDLFFVSITFNGIIPNTGNNFMDVHAVVVRRGFKYYVVPGGTGDVYGDDDKENVPEAMSLS